MSYDANFINDNGKIISPEVELLKTGIESLKLTGNTLLELGNALNEQSARLEKVLAAVQEEAVRKLKSAMEEWRKSENHGDMVSG